MRSLPVITVEICRGCHACCIEGWAELGPGDDPTLYQTVPFHGGLAVAKAANGDCVYLERGVGCRVYDTRPSVCRATDCVASYWQGDAMMSMAAAAGGERAAWA